MHPIGDFTRPMYRPRNADPTEQGVPIEVSSEVGVGTLAAAEAKAKVGHMTVSGHDSRVEAAVSSVCLFSAR